MSPRETFREAFEEPDSKYTRRVPPIETFRAEYEREERARWRRDPYEDPFYGRDDANRTPKATKLASQATWLHRGMIWPNLVCARYDCAVTCRLYHPDYIWKISHENSERILTIKETMEDRAVWNERTENELIEWSYLVHEEFAFHADILASLTRGEERRSFLDVPETTKVVHISEVDHNDPRVVYIGRAMRGVRGFASGPIRDLPGSIWANPYRTPQDGNRVHVIFQYEDYLRRRLCASPAQVTELEKLNGKLLACWCKRTGSTTACHGDVLVALLQELREHGAVFPRRASTL